MSHFKSAPSSLSNCKISRKKQKCPSFGPKGQFRGIFDQRCLIWVLLGNNFKKAIIIFEVSTLKFVYLQNFTKKQNCLNLGPKCLIHVFYLEFKKKYCYIWNYQPRIYLIAKFPEKIKMPKFGTKMPDLDIFGLEFQNCYCHIWNQHLWICLIAKFCEETKIPKFGTKNTLFGYFWTRVLKTIAIFEITPSNLSKMNL